MEEKLIRVDMTEKEKQIFTFYGGKDFLNYLDRDLTEEEYDLFIGDLLEAMFGTLDEDGEYTDTTYFIEDFYDDVLGRAVNDEDKYFDGAEFYEKYYAYNDALHHKYYYDYYHSKDKDK